MGKFFFKLTAALAEMERGIIGERTQAALARKKERREVYGEIPFGFDAVDGKLVPDQEEQDILTRIRQLRADGLSFQKVADSLNSTGVSAKKGGLWDRARVFKIMQKAA